MMKKTCALLFALALALSLSVPAFAYTTETLADGGVTYTPEYIFDGAGLLDIDAFIALEDAAATAAQYGCGVYLYTTDDMELYGYYDIEDFAEAVYDELDLGMGSDRSGVLLVLSMYARDYDLLAYGTTGNAAFTDYGKEQLAEEFLDNFRSDDWAGGFTDYVDASLRYLEANANGTPVDVAPSEPTSIVFRLVVGLVGGFIPAILIALLVCTVLKLQLKSVRRADGAAHYAVSGGADITLREDNFTHTTEVRTPKADSDGGGKHHGGGGTTTNSRGFSHSSGKF